MRLRILELPSESVGEALRTPFVVVIDRADRDEYEMCRLREGDITRSTGAQTTLIFDADVELG